MSDPTLDGRGSVERLHFDQLHIDVARNATDDFNPFHDPNYWTRIRGNPFGGPIVLGFQLECLVDDRIEQRREAECIAGGGFDFSNYEFHFAGALRAAEGFSVQVRRTLRKNEGETCLNRVVLRKDDGSAILLGSRGDGPTPQVPADWEPVAVGALAAAEDRALLGDTGLFYKRKYLNVSNAKNFLLASLVDPFRYFDELSERICFPPVFPVSLVSCALLEHGLANGYDFAANPRVYVSHRISIDRRIQRRLSSNDRLDMLVDGPHRLVESGGLGNANVEQQRFRCSGHVAGRGWLFRAEVKVAELSALKSLDTPEQASIPAGSRYDDR